MVINMQVDPVLLFHFVSDYVEKNGKNMDKKELRNIVAGVVSEMVQRFEKKDN